MKLTPMEYTATVVGIIAVAAVILVEIVLSIVADKPRTRREVRRHRRRGGHWPTKPGDWTDAELKALTTGPAGFCRHGVGMLDSCTACASGTDDSTEERCTEPGCTADQGGPCKLDPLDVAAPAAGGPPG